MLELRDVLWLKLELIHTKYRLNFLSKNSNFHIFSYYYFIKSVSK